MNNLWQDLRYGVRMLLKAPGFTAVAVLTLALGIGVSTSIFTVVDGVLLRKLPIKDPDRVVVIHNQMPRLNLPRTQVSGPQYKDYSREQMFDNTAAQTGRNFNLTGTGTPERLQAGRVTASFFSTLGITPAAGRFFAPEEDQVGNDHVTVLSFALWKRLFNSNPNILNSELELNRERYRVIGVAPESIEEMYARYNVWIPMAFTPGELSEERRGSLQFTMLARLKDDTNVTQAQGVMAGVARTIRGDKPSDFNIEVRPITDEYVGDVRKPLFLLLCAVASVLLISCGNIASLLLARGSVRAHEMALRATLGAGRIRLVRQLLTESFILAVMGGALGILLAFWGTRGLLALAPSTLPRLSAVHLDLRVLLLSCAVSLGCGLVFGLIPALSGSRMKLVNSLKQSGRTDSGGGSRQLLRRVLVVSEVALALILLVCSGLLVRSFKNLLNIQPGFDPHNVLTMRISLPGTQYDRAEKVAQFYNGLLPEIAALPGVTHVATAFQPPFTPGGDDSVFVIRDRRQGANDPPPHADYAFVSSDYFKSIGLPLLRGRDFEPSDMRAGNYFAPNSVAIVDDELAKRFWPNGDALGGGISWSQDGPWATVIGIVATAQLKDLSEPAKGTFYLPSYFGSSTLVVRTSGDPRPLTQAIREQVLAKDGNQPIYDVKTMDERVAVTLETRRFAVTLLGVFGGLALMLAVIGLYGVLAFAVTERTRELGIRMAIGAQAGDVLGLVLKQGMSLVLAGAILGVAGAYALTRLMQSLLFGVSATDPITFALMPTLLAAVGFVACYVPARRATKVDPLVALRHE